MRQVQTDYTLAEMAQKLLRLQGEPYSLRNYPIHGSVGDYLRILQDPKESEELKVAMLQALAWYRLSRERQNIAQACRRLQRDKHASPAVRTEAERTYYRLINE